MKIFKCIVFIIAAIAMSQVFATVTVKMALVKSGKNMSIGDIVATDSKYGLIITPELSGLTKGEHGFHLHINPSCGNGGEAAGGHFDPAKTGKHMGPFVNSGHLGDLPILYVDKDGNAQQPMLAPRLKESDLKGHAIIIHMHGDNYSDIPKKLGGGGPRVACGVVG